METSPPRGTPHQATPFPSPSKQHSKHRYPKHPSHSHTPLASSSVDDGSRTPTLHLNPPGAPLKAKQSRKDRQSASSPATPSPSTVPAPDSASPSDRKTHAFSPKRSSSLSLTFNPIRTTLLEESETEKEDVDTETEATQPSKKAQLTETVDRVKEFEKKSKMPIQSPFTSPSKSHPHGASGLFTSQGRRPSIPQMYPHAQVPPQLNSIPASRAPSSSFQHARPTEHTLAIAQSQTRYPFAPSHPQPDSHPHLRRQSNPLAYYDQSGNPEPEDNFYSNAPAKTHASASRRPSFPQSAQTSPSSKKVSLSPAHSPSQVVRASQPHPHPLLSLALGLHFHEDETHIIEFTDSEVSSVGDRDREDDDDDEENEYSSRPPSRLDDFIEFITEGGNAGHGRRASIVAGVPVDVPSTVDEEDEEKEGGEWVCTGCGCQPDQSFVALIPCDHLVCHQCVNNLINATAHKPPRAMDCFACAVPIESFTPAWEGTKGKSMVEALRESLDMQASTRKSNDLPPSHSPPRGKSRSASSPAAPSLPMTSAFAPAFVPGPQYATPPGSRFNHGHHYSAGFNVIPQPFPQYPVFPMPYPPPYGTPPAQNWQAHYASIPPQFFAGANPGPPLHHRSSYPPQPYPPQPYPPHQQPSAIPPAQAPKTPPRTAGNLKPSSPTSPAKTYRSKSSPSTASPSSPVRHIHSRAANASSSTNAGTPELVRDNFSPHRRLDWASDTTPGLGMHMSIGMSTPPQIHIVGESMSPLWNNSLGRQNSTTFKSPIEVQQLHELKDPIDWPTVRLDNIPWDITVAQVEAWLPPNSLAPSDKCVLAVHILCNRACGRTLNQCYVEASSVDAARQIVRTRDGKKLLNRPVHITISSSTEFMNTLFPSWDPGFNGHEALPGPAPGPLLLQTEVTGLLSLCKLESPHAGKVKERPYFNIVTILQKFPWHQVKTYNSKAIVRLFNTAVQAAEILGSLRQCVPDWLDILTVVTDAVVACPVFRSSQKTAFLRGTGMTHDKFPNAKGTAPTVLDGFGFQNAMRDSFVTVGFGGVDEGSPDPNFLLDVDLVPHADALHQRLHKQPSVLNLRPPPEVRPGLTKAISAPSLRHQYGPAKNDGSPVQKKRRRRLASISKALAAQFGPVDAALIQAIAMQLLPTEPRNLA